MHACCKDHCNRNIGDERVSDTGTDTQYGADASVDPYTSTEASPTSASTLTQCQHVSHALLLLAVIEMLVIVMILAAPTTY